MGMTSPFAEQERAAGAIFVEHVGVRLPEQYGNPDLEYRAVRAGAGLVDLTFHGMLALTGGERLRWLNGQISNEVKALKTGEGRLAAALTAKGHLLADLAVYGLPDSVWIDLPRERVAAVRDTFERHIIADDVQVEDLSDRFAHLMLVGPQAPQALAGTLGPEILDLRPWQHAEGRLDGVLLRIVASRWLALPGFDVFVPIDAAGQVWGSLLRCGREVGLRPVGMTALEWLRVEAGWPWFGVDFDENNLLMESLTPDHVSLTKGCYVGQEVVTRIEHQGHLNKKLYGLLLDGMSVPARGMPIRLGERTVGHVTSAVRSPALDRAIALGYLRRECWERGATVQIGILDGSLGATVTPLPFVAGTAATRPEGAG